MSIKWEKDNEICYCNKCKDEFTFFLRKHHCRLCGKIFCYRCIIYSENEKRFISCNNCNINSKYDLLLSVLKLVEIYNLNDLKSLSLVNKKWYNVSKIILNDFYSLQFNFNKLTNYEKNLLSYNLNYIRGHFNYIYKSLFLKKDDLLYILNCKNLNCINCSHININNFICLLNNSNLFEIFSEKILNNGENRFEFIFYICSYIHIFILSIDDKLLNTINNVCSKNNIFFFHFFWSLEILSFIKKKDYDFFQTIRNTIFINFNIKQKSIIKEIYNFIDLMKSVDITNSQDINFNLINSYLYAQKPIYIFNHKIRLHKLININIKNSNSKPIIYKFKTDNNENVSFLFKKEDMLIDYIIINCINYTKNLLSKIIPEKYIVTYNIIPYKNKFGLIEIVKNSKTLSDINNLNISLTNYIYNNNNNLSIDTIRTNFLYSLSFYSIICYILGLGDRHLDNIMITNNGLIFHIDFSFILGNDPKKKIAPEIRITQEMIDVLGGMESEYYKKFQLVCRKSFLIIKHYFNTYYELLLPLSEIDNNNYSKNKIQNFLKGRFMTDLSYKVADIKFNNQILLDKSSQSLLIDYFHNYGIYKDNIQNIVTYKLSNLW